MPPRPVLKYRHRHKTYYDATGRRYTPYDPNWRPRQHHRPRHQSTHVKRIRARLRSDRRLTAADIIARAYRNRYARRVIAPQIRATARDNLQFYHAVRDYDRDNAARTIARSWTSARPRVAERTFWSRWNAIGPGSYHPELR
jgi:hypothetical protein